MTLHEYIQLENRLPELDEIEIGGVPIWRIVRTRFRWIVLDSYPFTVQKNFKIWKQLKNNHRSFCGLVKLLLFRHKVKTVFFPHPRLYLVKDLYLERMTDPMIDFSGIKNDYLILERHQNGLHKEPRLHSEKVVYLDFIDNLARVIKPLSRLINKFRYGKEINSIIDILSKEFQFDKSRMKNLFLDTITFTFLQKTLIAPILNALKPNQVFLAPRQTFQFVIAYCKKHRIATIELQHGVTIGETELYSGTYNCKIDPDYFCVFGKANEGSDFGIPTNRIKCLGFPYKNFIKNLNCTFYGDNVVLVISDSDISEKIVNLLTSFVDYYPHIVFHIRCHPQERFSKELLECIQSYKQIKIVDNKIESFCALSQYNIIIGDNSTVLYEAMSMKKRVGRLNYNGFHVQDSAFIYGGTIINSHDELIQFVNEKYCHDNYSCEIYSDFNLDTLNEIIQI